MRNIIQELRSVEGELERKSSSAKHDPELAAAMSLELLEELKHALDHLRHMIWPYMIAMQQNSPENVEYALQLYRMQRVREMLKSLKSMERVTKDDAPMQLFMSELARMLQPDDDFPRQKPS